MVIRKIISESVDENSYGKIQFFYYLEIRISKIRYFFNKKNINKIDLLLLDSINEIRKNNASLFLLLNDKNSKNIITKKINKKISFKYKNLEVKEILIKYNTAKRKILEYEIDQQNNLKEIASHIKSIDKLEKEKQQNSHKIFFYDDYHSDTRYIEAKKKSEEQTTALVKRSDIINFLLDSLKRDTNYLEIGVRDPRKNFDLIKSKNKYSVDPGIEFEQNPVDFKITSDEFFDQLEKGEILHSEIQFDVIFIDGLHTAEQVQTDIINSMKYIKKDGFVVLHDCNPPTAWHAREDFYYNFTPAVNYWNGTVWKSFLKWRTKEEYSSCCIDTDWGVGILSKGTNLFGKYSNLNSIDNEFYNFNRLDKNRKKNLNLISFEELKKNMSYDL